MHENHQVPTTPAAPAKDAGPDLYEASGLKFRAYFEPAWGVHPEPGIVVQVEDRPSAVYGYGWVNLADIADEHLSWEANLWASAPVQKAQEESVRDLREKIRDAYLRLVA